MTYIYDIQMVDYLLLLACSEGILTCHHRLPWLDRTAPPGVLAAWHITIDPTVGFKIFAEKMTWLAGKSPFLIGDTASNACFFHCHVSFPGCR